MLFSVARCYVQSPGQTVPGKNRSAQNLPDIRSLQVGKPIERALSGGETHSYQISLEASQFVHIVVDQKGIDLVVTLFGPDGKEIVKVDSPNGTWGPEPVRYIADVSGLYRLEVQSLEKTAAAGRYEARIEELRMSTAEDRPRIAAQAISDEAYQYFAQGTPDSLPKALSGFQEALTKWQALGDRKKELDTLIRIGQVNDSLANKTGALDAFNKALALSRSTGDRQGEGITLNQIGNHYASSKDEARALDSYNQALAIFRDLGDKRREAYLLNNIGEVYWGGPGTERPKGADYFLKALPIMQSIGDRYGEAHVLRNLGLLYEGLGETQKALDSFLELLPVLRILGNRTDEGETLVYIGRNYSTLGENQKALDYYNKALEVNRLAGDAELQAATFRFIGATYFGMGDLDKAAEYYEEAGNLDSKNPDGHAATLHVLAAVYARQGNTAKAIELFSQALTIWRALGKRREEGSTLTSIGSVYRDLGQYQKSLDNFNQALMLKRSLSDRRGESSVLSNLGQVYVALGDPKKALDYYKQALALSESAADRQLQALALNGIARSERDLGSLSEARVAIEQALAIVESIRSGILSFEERASYIAFMERYYELDIDILMRLHQLDPVPGYDALALQTSERARARSLIELLAEAGVDLRSGVDPKLLEREASLLKELNARAEQQMKLLNEKQSDEQVEALKKEISDLVTQHQEVEGRIRNKSPRYAGLLYPQPLTAGEIRREVLDPDTLLVEYALGEEHSYLWVISAETISSFTLPPRRQIEDAARRVYKLLTARNEEVRFETAEEKRQRIARSDDEYQRAAIALSEMILAPAASKLNKKRLLITTDGALAYLPFAALGLTSTAHSGSDGKGSGQQVGPGWRPLILDHEVVVLPSATTLAVLRRELGARPEASKTVAVLADPVFEKSDERFAALGQLRQVRLVESNVARKAAPTLAETELVRSARETGTADAGMRIKRLPFTRVEANEITALVPEGESKKALDFDASRSTAISGVLGQYRFVHFATHGLLNSVHPELSGIILSLVDRQGASQDGFLRVNEIFNLKLQAELVVLSGCRTGLGKEIRGEGFVGLTQGFMYAGAKRVVVSLWSVSDEASAELMSRMYRGLLGKESLSPAAALRAAQLGIMEKKRWRAPYYWAGFVIEGEPR